MFDKFKYECYVIFFHSDKQPINVNKYMFFKNKYDTETRVRPNKFICKFTYYNHYKATEAIVSNPFLSVVKY